MHLRVRRYLTWTFPLITIGIASLLIQAHSKALRATGALSHQVYVWQRSYTPELTAAIASSTSQFDEVVSLAAEFSWPAGHARLVRIPLDYAALRTTAKPIGLAIRIGAFSGPFTNESPASVALRGTARSILRDARGQGLSVAELQIDFDCAESKLAGYQQWLESLRPLCAAENVRLTITSLPSWLDCRSFSSLAAAVDGFVLQVHSFKPPSIDDGCAAICDPDAAKIAVERAARLGRPFRVALPTYSYLAGYDANNKLLGISAEGPLPQWPDSSRLQLVHADPTAMAALIRGWTRDRPANLLGVIWYRLPVTGDTLNWRPQTLAAVMAGSAPIAKLAVRSARAADGATEISLENNGDADAYLDSAAVVIDQGDMAVEAFDALSGFVLGTDGQTTVRFEASAALALQPLAPGESIVAGWIRTTNEREVHGHVESVARGAK